MSESEFREYVELAARAHILNLVRSEHRDVDEAKELAEEALVELLPKGLASKNRYLYSVVEDSLNVTIGFVVVGIKERRASKSAYLYDFIIFNNYRRQGFGTETLSALEKMVAALDCDSISLNVFENNRAAQALYEKCGYEILSFKMRKKLP